jgi:hypothetical protein
MPLIDLTYPENALSNSGVHRLSQLLCPVLAFPLADTPRTSVHSVAQ